MVALATLAAGGSLFVAISGSSGADRPSAGAAQAGNTLNVRLDEFDFGQKTRIDRGGRTTVRLWNAGRNPHNWTIVSGPTRPVSRTLDRNGRQDISLDLRPGAYVVVCTVGDGNHIAQGMYRMFTVGQRNRETGRWESIRR
jgi:plastocyanin